MKCRLCGARAQMAEKAAPHRAYCHFVCQYIDYALIGKGKKRERQEEEDPKNWYDFDKDVLSNILLHLPLRDFERACRTEKRMWAICNNRGFLISYARAHAAELLEEVDQHRIFHPVSIDTDPFFNRWMQIIVDSGIGATHGYVIFWAAYRNDPHLVQMLSGIQDFYLFFDAALGAGTGGHPEAIRAVFSNAQHKRRMMAEIALKAAIDWNHLEIVEVLLDLGVIYEGSYLTAIKSAAGKMRTDIFLLLFERDPNIDVLEIRKLVQQLARARKWEDIDRVVLHLPQFADFVLPAAASSAAESIGNLEIIKKLYAQMRQNTAEFIRTVVKSATISDNLPVVQWALETTGNPETVRAEALRIAKQFGSYNVANYLTNL